MESTDLTPIRISAKDLAATAMADFCPRCFWIRLHCKLPWQTFPGIFASIDSYTKKVVHAIIDTNEHPPWLALLGDVKGYQTVKKCEYLHKPTNITVAGIPDDLLVLVDGSIVIPDYKTAKYTKTQDTLLPLYEVQLNLYSLMFTLWAAKMFLVYMEPLTYTPQPYREQGFSMAFDAKVHQVETNKDNVRKALQMTRQIHDGPIPVALDGCKNCDALAGIVCKL